MPQQTPSGGHRGPKSPSPQPVHLAPGDAGAPPPLPTITVPSHLMCHVCVAPLREPRILQCLHTACAACLAAAGGGAATSLSDNDHRGDGDGDDVAPAGETYAPFKPPLLLCPICAFPTTTNTIDRLPHNFAAIKELRALQNMKSCHNCNEADADIYCPECASAMCADCSQRIHVHRIFQSHAPVALRQQKQLNCSTLPLGAKKHEPTAATMTAAAALSVIKEDMGYLAVPCYRHVHEFQTSFCRVCNHSVCPRCIEEEHAAHPIGTFKHVLDRSLADDLPEYEETLRSVMRQCVSATCAVEEAVRDLEAHRLQCQRTLDDQMRSVLELVQRRRGELEREISSEYHRKAHLLHQQLETLRHRKDGAGCALWLAATLSNYSTATASDAASPSPTAGHDDHSNTTKRNDHGTHRSTDDDVLLRPPCNTTPSVVADATVALGKVIMYTESQRIDATPNVETKLKIAFTGQVEPLEKLLQHFGAFYSKRSRERKFPPPTVDELSFQPRPLSALGRSTPGAESRSLTPQSQAGGGSTVPAAAVAPYFAPLSRATSETTGILYFFGCDGGIKTYQNPLQRGQIDVRASSVGYGKLEHVVHFSASQRARSRGGDAASPIGTASPERGRSAPGAAPGGTSSGGKEFCTENHVFSWVTIKLPAAVELEAYTLYHDAFDPTSHYLRSWEMRGLVATSVGAPAFSDACFTEDAFRAHYHYAGPLYVEQSEGNLLRAHDPEALRRLEAMRSEFAAASAARAVDQQHLVKWWIVLDSRRHSEAIRSGSLSACFYVQQHQEPHSAEAHPPIPCRQFMLVQTGVNSSGNHHLMVSCMELFGVLLAS